MVIHVYTLIYLPIGVTLEQTNGCNKWPTNRSKHAIEETYMYVGPGCIIIEGDHNRLMNVNFTVYCTYLCRG